MPDDRQGDRSDGTSTVPRFESELDTLRSVVEIMPDGLVVADPSGRFLYFNSAAETILGIGKRDVETREWARTYGLFRVDGSAPIPAEELPLARATRGESVSGYELLVRNPARPEGVVIRIDARPLRSPDGSLAGGVATFRDVTATRRASDIVNRLSIAIERTGDAVMITAVDGTIQYVNRAFERQTGFARDEAIGRTPRILKSDQHDDAFFGRMWSTILAGREFRGTILNRKKDGGLYWSLQTITPIQAEDGRVTHFVSLLKDVTEREVELRHERDFNAAILSTAGAPVLVTDPDSRVIRFNPACENAAGFGADALRGVRLLDHPLVACDADRWRSTYDEVLRTGEPTRIELHWTCRHGDRRTIDWSFRTLRDGGDRPTYVVASGVDVTERRAAREALEESERRNRLLVENLHEGLWLIDRNDVTTFVNDRMAEMLGYTTDEMVGRPLFDFMDEAGIAVARRNIERRKRGITEDHEFELIAKDGTRVYTIMQASPITDRAGNYQGALAGVLDIGERRRQEARLQRAHDQLEERVAERTAELRAALEEVRSLKDRAEEENVLLREQVRRSRSTSAIVCESRAIRTAMESMRRVARTDASVLLLGETGSGKGLFARAIHEQSRLADRPLVTVDCAALPASLIESELFGHEKGAFTGAERSRPGRFEIADGGTIFLDEIGDLPADLQAKLLRLLQSGEFERLGSGRTRSVRVRVIAATHRDLRSMVERGDFRSDLYFRLNVFPIRIPPLRERLDDIPGLVRGILESRGGHHRRSASQIPETVFAVLREHTWPGNVRELENVIERALITATGGLLRPDVLHEAIERTRERPPPDPERSGTLEDHERAHIERVLAQCGGRIKGRGNAAERLGLAPSTLRDRIKKLGLRRPR